MTPIVITLDLAKRLAQNSYPAPQDHGGFLLVNFLSFGEGDAEALGILLANRRNFCRALAERFNERIQPHIHTLVQQFVPACKSSKGQVVLVYGGKSRTVHLDDVHHAPSRSELEARRAMHRAERLAASPKGMIGQKPNKNGKKAA